MNKILKRLITTALFVVMFTMAFKSTTPVQAATPTVTITYNANGGVYNTGSKSAKQTVVKDANVILLPPSVERSGYIFLGYAQNNRASYPGYLLCNKYKFSNNITLYAVWVKRTEIYDRYGDSFSYGLNMSQLESTLDLFAYSAWIGKSQSVKESRMRQLASKIAGMYGVAVVPQIKKGIPVSRLAKGVDPANVMGLYAEDVKTIYLNPILYDDDVYEFSSPTEKEVLPSCHKAARTIAHEMRHAYQHQRARNPHGKTDYLYAYNLGYYNYGHNYIDPKSGGLNYNEYQDQLVEAEAFGVEKQLQQNLKILLNPFFK